MKLVSIIIPNYNGEKTIVDTIQSVINQTYRKWEVIVIDDGSSDNSEFAVKSIDDSRIRFIKRPKNRKKGGNTCRNIGIENALGNYVIFLDADDLLADYCLEQRVLYMQQNPELDFAVFNMYRFVDTLKCIELHTKLNTDNPLPYFLGLNCLWQTTCPIWKKEIVEKYKFNEDFLRLQDPEMIVRVLWGTNLKYQLVKNSKPDAFYRIIQKNKSKVNQKRKVTSNYNIPFKQFVDEFYPLGNSDILFEKSKKSLFYQLSMHHILAADKDNIDNYKECIIKIAPHLSLIDKVIFKCCINMTFMYVAKNKIIRKICSLYIPKVLNKIWGKMSINY